jgi:hypothetical protein
MVRSAARVAKPRSSGSPHQYDRHEYRSIADAYFSPGASAHARTEVAAAQAESLVRLVYMNYAL